MLRPLLLLLVLACTPFEQAQAQVTCSGNEALLRWPAVNPIWEMCWLRPSQSSGPRGSGMELRNVHYKGQSVLKRLHSPMLFAEYVGNTCYRDWKDANSSFIGQSTVRNQLGVATAFPTTTSCDRSMHPTQSYGTCPFQVPGRTSGDCFTGLAIEDHGNYVSLTTQYSADWYLYTSRAFFYANGSFDLQFGFGNSNGTNNSITHWHHNYWRLDFDIDGADNNVLSINNVAQPTEFFSLINPTGGPSGGPRTYEVRNSQTGRGYRMIPGDADYASPVNQSGRNFHLTDVLGTVYRANEYTDRGSTNNLGDCAMLHGNLVNGENIIGSGAGADVVLYYRVGVRDLTGVNSMICKSAGPAFIPLGNWDPTADLFVDGFDS